ncbi:unnamed protein product [Cuscuta campestris]|uniref:Ribosomal protein L34e superfamily protein n=2 Tax=Cuscuta sect. Cleistogrammica TaxID=1824901 RepID=A0A484M8V4_9ASTE|nr:hypothetical protein DM860_002448 [Cuscuta australis]VFQ85293.1 unnamed protein product [Cuscuta campestris]
MRHPLLSSSIAMAPSSISLSKPLRKPSPSVRANPNVNSSHNCPSSAAAVPHHPCKHSPSATLDILILVLVLFSGAFLISSYFSYIFHSLSLLAPSFSVSALLSYLSSFDVQIHYVLCTFFFAIFVAVAAAYQICCGNRSRKCGKSGCKGLRKAMEFDLQVQEEECLKLGDESKAVREINELPWKGGSETNLDYECLRAELRKMAPPNGRAVLLFRAKCGCPIAKLEGWGPKRGRRHKKSIVGLNGRDHL